MVKKAKKVTQVASAKAKSKGAPKKTSASAKAKVIAKPKTLAKNASSRPTKAKKSAESGKPDVWTLRLYVAGQTPKSLTAFTNLKKVCEEHLAGRYVIEVIDLLKNPQLAASDQILAIPTLVRKVPSPMKKIIGDLSNVDRFLIGFDLKPMSTT